LERRLIEVAVERRDALVALFAQDDARSVLEAALKSSVRAALPSSVATTLEHEVDVAGTLEILHEHWAGGSEYHYFLKSGATRYSLHFARKPPDSMLTAASVRAKGTHLGTLLALSSGEQVQQATPAPAPPTIGEQRTLVMLVNFQDAPTEPYTPAAAHDVVFGSTSAFFAENSYRQTWLAGDVVGWLTIPLSSAVCDFDTLAGQARQAAANVGIVLANYTHYAYAFAKNACTGLAWGTVGGYPSHAWFNGEFDMPAVAHELGHNLGLYHSHALDCGTVTEGGTCTTFEYGDRSTQWPIPRLVTSMHSRRNASRGSTLQCLLRF
jgi:hypothetical protein